MDIPARRRIEEIARETVDHAQQGVHIDDRTFALARGVLELLGHIETLEEDLGYDKEKEAKVGWQPAAMIVAFPYGNSYGGDKDGFVLSARGEPLVEMQDDSPWIGDLDPKTTPSPEKGIWLWVGRVRWEVDDGENSDGLMWEDGTWRRLTPQEMAVLSGGDNPLEQSIADLPF